MPNIFKNLRIGPRLTLGFGASIALVMLTGAVSLFAAGLIQQANAEQVASVRKAELALEIEVQMLEARRREKDFLLRWRDEGFQTAYDNYVILNQQHTQNVRNLLDELRLLTASETELVESIESIEQKTLSYDQLFIHVTGHLQERGHFDTGLEGAFRDDVHALEDSPIFVNNAELTTTLLQMRRSEKDYLLRGLQEDVDEVAQFNQQLQGQMNTLYIPEADKTSLLQLATAYLEKFNALVDLDAEIQAESEEFAATAQSIAPLVDLVKAAALADEAVAVANYEQIAAPLRTIILGLLGAGVVMGVVLAAVIYRSITVPIRDVITVATGFSQGDLSLRSRVAANDETGFLAQTINNMADRLQGVIDGLEARTRDLQTVSDVGVQVATILEPERLLRDVSDLTKERFGLYHAHIYLLNDSGDTLVLTAGAGHVGRQMVSEKRSILFNNPHSIVATAARNRNGVIFNDVRQSPTFLPHPLLPDTRSELAVPLIARGQLLGVLDVQSNQVGYFDENSLTTFDLMAGQIAVAISNAQLYELAERTSRHERALGQIDRSIQNANSMDEILQATVRELGKALRVPYTAVELQLNPKSGSDPSQMELTIPEDVS
jgi:putative methionine-R-sulfoxide reductase with GAF domain